MKRRAAHVAAILACLSLSLSTAGGALADGAIAAATPPSAILHEPVSVATGGESIPIGVTLSGYTGPAPSVTVHFRSVAARDYETMLLSAGGEGGYVGRIPAVAETELSLRYFIVVTGPSYRTTLGSSEMPLRIDLLAPERPASRRTSFVLLSASLLALLVTIGLRFRNRRRVLDIMDRISWVKALTPLAHLTGPELTREVTRLSRTPLNHPTKGLTMYPRHAILKKLHDVKAVDLVALIEARDRFLGEDYDPEPLCVTPREEPDPARDRGHVRARALAASGRA